MSANILLASAQRVPPCLIMDCMNLVDLLESTRGRIVGGYQTALERDALDILLGQKTQVMLVPARNYTAGDRLYSGSLWQQVKKGVDEDRVRIVSPPSVRGTRITRANAEIRNAYLLEIADVLLVLSAPPESKTHALALKALGQGMPVFTFEHGQHQALFAAGAQIATIHALVAATGNYN